MTDLNKNILVYTFILTFDERKKGPIPVIPYKIIKRNRNVSDRIFKK